jgi:hypothetical protein
MGLLEAFGLRQRPRAQELPDDVALGLSELCDLLEERTLLGLVVRAKDAERVEAVEERVVLLSPTARRFAGLGHA